MLLSDAQIYSQKLSNKQNAFLCQSPLTTLFFAQITQQRKCHQQLCPPGGRRAGQGHRTALRGSLGSCHPVPYCKRTAEGKSSTGMLQELGSTQRNCPPSMLGTTQTHLLLSPSKEALPVAALFPVTWMWCELVRETARAAWAVRCNTSLPKKGNPFFLTLAKAPKSSGWGNFLLFLRHQTEIWRF